ncbi:uncharacterized protein PV09_09617 [Verruconis gallopava]|uniref:Endonuclease/exonuclease/phosphatase domain-containing protein n=1 Tax=Verruconis gallopava TaxID=253628 RepID=A0A0D1X942_9PEZI|nr:uncharacterized protein PV09_09617 [Verruconis gallopava]KIV98600.1 hypothetical protein PV09_09617 [Verruconis gallopava]
MLGDFNLNHPVWGGKKEHKHEEEAEELLDIMQNTGMTNMLRSGTITYEEGEKRSTIELCWMSAGLTDRLIRCEADRDMEHDSDHLSISIFMDLRVQHGERKAVR